MTGRFLEPGQDPMSRRDFGRRQRRGLRLIALFFLAWAMMLVLPLIVRQLGDRVPAEEPYTWSGDSTVFVRMDNGDACTVARSDGTTERVYVPADNTGWVAVSGVDVTGTAHATTTMTCQDEAIVTTGVLRLLGYPFRFWAASGLVCIGFWIAAIWVTLRTVYLRLRRGIQ